MTGLRTFCLSIYGCWLWSYGGALEVMAQAWAALHLLSILRVAFELHERAAASLVVYF